MSMQFAKIRFTEDNIGPHLLESITKGLYVNPLHTIREYVQNEVEADPPATSVKVHIGGKEISIWGDGGGMNREMILNSAMRIGFSTKDPAKHFGFRGIGIWSGVAVCDNILISTKRENEDRKYFVKIDAKKIREEIRRKAKKLTAVLTENVEIAEASAPLEEHGTHVRLINILDDSIKYLLSPEDVMKYMSLALPVDFEPGFVYKKEITKKLKENVPNYRTIKVFLEENPIYRAPFLNKLDPPEFRILKVGKNVLAFCWFCMHRYKKAIGDVDSRGLVYKKYGFTVGDRDVCLNWWEKSRHLLNWCVGETHVINLNILPNSERIDFESSPEKDMLISQLKEIVQADIDEASRKKSHFDLMKKRIKEVATFPEKPTFTSTTERATEISKVHTLQEHLKRAKKHRYTRKFASDKEKKNLDKSIAKTRELLKAYSRIPAPEEVKEIPKPPEVVEIPKAPEALKVEAKLKPSYLSFSDLLEGLKLETESQAILQSIEEVLDEYFAADPQICTEIKQRIASKIKQQFS